MGTNSSWDNFIQGELLCTGLVSGVALLTHQGQCVYTYGVIPSDAPSDTWHQFRGVFERATERHNKKVCNAGFSLPHTDSSPQHYTVVRKNLSSLYCTGGGGGGEGLVVCNIAYGLLVCVHRRPDCAGRIITAVENFANLLRA